jgi:hypothetical protein
MRAAQESRSSAYKRERINAPFLNPVRLHVPERLLTAGAPPWIFSSANPETFLFRFEQITRTPWSK